MIDLAFYMEFNLVTDEWFQIALLFNDTSYLNLLSKVLIAESVSIIFSVIRRIPF